MCWFNASKAQYFQSPKENRKKIKKSKNESFVIVVLDALFQRLHKSRFKIGLKTKFCKKRLKYLYLLQTLKNNNNKVLWKKKEKT